MNEINRIVCRYKLVSEPLEAREAEKIVNSEEIYDFLISDVFDKETIDVTESFYAVFLNSDNRVKGFIKVSEGGVNRTTVDAKVIFSAALKCLATAVVFAHNHPSGNPCPSEQDKELTKKLVAGAKVLDIIPIDHVIVTGNGCYYSFRDYGLI